MKVKVSIVKVPIPASHPRRVSLTIREKLVEGLARGVVVPEGLIAHGRGECFDYLIGEKTRSFALKAIKAAASMLLLAEKPVISVNGNMAALCARELAQLANLLEAPIEVNLFYRSKSREKAVASTLKSAGANIVLTGKPTMIPLVESLRRFVQQEGSASADVVFVGIEDGDRVEALRRLGKAVIAVDLNPLSRSALKASITIVDNAVRALPKLIAEIERLRGLKRAILERRVKAYDNRRVLAEALNFMADRLRKLAEGRLGT